MSFSRSITLAAPLAVIIAAVRQWPHEIKEQDKQGGANEDLIAAHQRQLNAVTNAVESAFDNAAPGLYAVASCSGHASADGAGSFGVQVSMFKPTDEQRLAFEERSGRKSPKEPKLEDAPADESTKSIESTGDAALASASTSAPRSGWLIATGDTLACQLEDGTVVPGTYSGAVGDPCVAGGGEG
jgi:hypothetical protein